MPTFSQKVINSNVINPYLAVFHLNTFNLARKAEGKNACIQMFLEWNFWELIIILMTFCFGEKRMFFGKPFVRNFKNRGEMFLEQCFLKRP